MKDTLKAISNVVASSKKWLSPTILLLRTITSMLVRIVPVILAYAATWLLLFQTEQGHDLLLAAKSDAWRAFMLLFSVFLFSLLSAFSTVYLLDLSPDWDREQIARRFAEHTQQKAKAKPEQASEPRQESNEIEEKDPEPELDTWGDEKASGERKEESGAKQESTKSEQDGNDAIKIRNVLISIVTLVVNISLFGFVSLYLLEDTAAYSILGLLAVVLGLILLILARNVLTSEERSKTFRTVTLVSCLGLLLVFAACPVAAGTLLGSELTLFILLSLWLMLTCVLLSHLSVFDIEVWQGLVVIYCVVWLAGAFSALLGGVSAPAPEIRCSGSSCNRPGSAQAPKKLDDAFSAWLDKTAKADRPPVLLLVSAAGGGARASYWTSIVLSRLHDRDPDLVRSHLFLASGVSGGALGLAVYAALSSTENPRCGKLEDCARAFGKADFLAPSLAALLAADAINTSLPYRFSFWSRDVALEQAWERHWHRTVGTDIFAEPFLGLWQSKTKPLPNLILNATSTRTGDRVLVSNLDAVSVGAPFNLAERIDLPLSSAVNASARFPFIDPPGAVMLPDKPDSKQWEVIADGGYYDNFGAATLLGVIGKLEGFASNSKEKKLLSDLVTIVAVQITSDPTPGMSTALDKGLSDDSFAEICSCKSRESVRPPPDDPAWWERFLQTSNQQQLERIRSWLKPPDPLEPAGVYGTLMKARTRSGSVFPIELRKKARDHKGYFFHFAMDNVQAPLGWSLSDSARTDLDALLNSDCHREQLDRIVALLRPPTTR